MTILLWAAAATGIIAFPHARVFDGEKVLTDVTVVVRGDRIESVGPDLNPPAEALIIGCSGRTLLPGFIDAHTHVWRPADLEQALAFGVTTELDMMAVPSVVAGLKNRAGLSDLRSAGFAATAPGAHGTEYGFPVPTISSAGDADAFVAARVREGSDYIKVIYTPGFNQERPSISKAVMSAVIHAAHARRKLAIVHIETLGGARDAIQAGADGLAHVMGDQAPDEGFLQLARGRGVFVVPTLAATHNLAGRSESSATLADPRLAALLGPEARVALNRTFAKPQARQFRAADAAVRALADGGIPLLVGSDAPNPGTAHGASLHIELALLVKMGLSPAAALTAATSETAKRFGLSGRGRIAPGMRADMVLVEGDPTRDVTATRAIAGVWKAGTAFNRSEWQKKVDAERVEAERRTAVVPVPRGSESGLVSDFEDGRLSARYGVWTSTTDQRLGGRSSAIIDVISHGAHESRGALRISGEVKKGSVRPYAGAIFLPAGAPWAPANLSSKKEIAFWARGQTRSYTVMLFAQSRGYAPVVQSFLVSTGWRQFRFPISSFDGLDGRDLEGIFIGASGTTGSFNLQIDDLEIR